VGTGSNRIRRTQVRIIRRAGETHLQVESPGPIQVRLINMFRIALKVHRVLLAAPGPGGGTTTAGMNKSWVLSHDLRHIDHENKRAGRPRTAGCTAPGYSNGHASRHTTGNLCGLLMR